MKMARLFDDHAREPFTLLGVGPMSPTVVDASIECAAEHDAPIVFIASRNQVEARDLGGGYVAGWTSRDLREYVRERAEAHGHAGPLYVGRDHGGPWQRDDDHRAGLGWEEAMDSAMRSYREDIEAGFDYLHIDTAKDPAFPRGVPLDLAADRAVHVLREVEAFRAGGGYPEVAYEVSLEEANGTSSTPADFAYFMDTLLKRVEHHGLPRPLFMVGNTGTLTGLSQAGRVDFETVGALAETAARHGVVLKEHNADYLPFDDLARHPAAGIGMANVAPEFGRLQTEALLRLAALEGAACRRRGLPGSAFGEILTDLVFRSDRWRKWVRSGADLATSDAVVLANGHYFDSHQSVRQARAVLMRNCATMGICADPAGFVRHSIKEGLRRYLFAFELTGRNQELCVA
ncbi:class II D-tagatose-bisphosphate aldolase non-catalytic subunit [Nonomuraea dietziae]|uniref:class II D-tagatose-bisphosphate aldolase non-catalytic subunit n=1 Tax=Nonomuraea dietziae TaxID=65515 RepID=UPI0034099334